MELSIIIVSYNVKKLVLECIDSIYKHLSEVSFEIIVVDNNSIDGTIDAIKKKFKEVQVIRNKQNLGFSEANNQGMKKSKGEYILLLNPDTFLPDNSLVKMLSYAKTQGNNIVLGPKLLNIDSSLQVSAWKDKSLTVMTYELMRIFTDRYPLDSFIQPTEVDNVAGAAMLFPKSVIESIGYLDPGLFWMEDFDFCYRLRKNGGKVIYFPDAQIVHYGGESSTQNLNMAYANANISKLKFYKKHFSPFKTSLAEEIIFLHIISRLLLFTILSPISINSRKYFSAYAFTLKKYFRYLLKKDKGLH